MENGQIKGPFPSESISKMIVEGILSGQEEVAQHPSAEWRPLSKVHEFYEALLESLENPSERDEKKALKMDAETQVQSAPVEAPADVPVDDVEAIPELKNEIQQFVEEELKKAPAPTVMPGQPTRSSQVPSVGGANATDALLQARDEQLTIEMQQLKKIQSRESKKFIPFVAIILAVIVGMYFVLTPSAKKGSGWVLIAPARGAEKKLSEAEVRVLKSKAIQLIKSGSLENTRDSQKFLAQASENAPNDLETLGLLCVVYEQLWPYTKQNSNDLKAITMVTQMSRTINPISNYSDTCQSVFLLAKGQPRDARGLIEKTLDLQNGERFILFPFLYLMKGQILEDMQNHISAEAYYTEAVKSFPGWAWAQFALARSYYKQAKYNEAKDQYTNILRDYPEYKGALYGMGLVEIKSGSSDKAMEHFNRAYAIDGKLPKTFHMDSLQEYIQLLITKKDSSKALEVGQFALTISPSHRTIKELVMSLGGEDRGNNQSAELVFLGDQFARSGDHLAAQAQYKAAFEFDKSNAEPALKAAKSLWAINQSRESLTWVDRAIKADPKLSQAYALKADYLSQKYSFGEATKTLQDAMRAGGLNFDVVKTQALVEFRKNSMNTAITYGEKAIKMYDADTELLSLIANANINLFLNSPSRTKEEENRKAKYLEDAQRYSSKAVDLEPGKPEAQITYSKYLYAKQGNIAAETNFKKLIETFPYTVDYRLGLAEFYELQEKYRSASEIYAQLVETDPKNKKALMGLARSNQYMNEIKVAQKYFMDAAVLDPSDVEPLFATAQLELENPGGRDANAIIQSAYKKFEMVKRVNPSYPRISYFLARCHFELGEFDKALEMIKDEKTKNPGIADPYLLAATVYNAKEQFKECAAEYSQGIKLRPTSADLYVRAANCYRKSDAMDIALDMLEIARTKESGFAPLYREKGYIMEAQGDRKAARELFRLYIELSPNALDRKQIEDKIGSLGG